MIDRRKQKPGDESPDAEAPDSAPDPDATNLKDKSLAELMRLGRRLFGSGAERPPPGKDGGGDADEKDDEPSV